MPQTSREPGRNVNIFLFYVYMYSEPIPQPPASLWKRQHTHSLWLNTLSVHIHRRLPGTCTCIHTTVCLLYTRYRSGLVIWCTHNDCILLLAHIHVAYTKSRLGHTYMQQYAHCILGEPLIWVLCHTHISGNSSTVHSTCEAPRMEAHIWRYAFLQSNTYHIKS